jgi:hypothetical protein
MSEPLPFSDFSPRFRRDLRARPIFYILSGPSLAKSSAAFGDHLGLNPMFGTHSEVSGILDLLRPLNRPLDIWMNMKTPQDVVDWRVFLEFMSNPDTGLILSPYAWMRHSHLMELEREFVIRRFHKVICMDFEVHMLIANLRVNENVNSILYFLFLAHLLEVKGPIFLFGCDGTSPSGDVDGYDNYYHGSKTNAKHLFYDSFDEKKIRGLMAAETQGTNENWPVFEQWFERRNIRRIPIYNVGGAGYIKAFEIIGPEEIPERVEQCNRSFDPARRTMTTGEHWDHATLQGNISQYDYFCSQYPSSELMRRLIPYLTESTKAIVQTKDQTLDALNMVIKLLMRLDSK